MFDVFWMISSDNGLKKKKHSGLVETGKPFIEQSQLLFSAVSAGGMLFKFCMLTW